MINLAHNNFPSFFPDISSEEALEFLNKELFFADRSSTAALKSSFVHMTKHNCCIQQHLQELSVALFQKHVARLTVQQLKEMVVAQLKKDDDDIMV